MNLLDKLEAATLAEVQQRHAEMKAEEQRLTGACDRGGGAAVFSAENYA